MTQGSRGPSPKLFGATLTVILAMHLAGCHEDTAPRLFIEVHSPVVLSTLTITIKQYQPDGSTVVYPEYEAELPHDADFYVDSVDERPLRIEVDVPSPDRYAVHLVGRQESQLTTVFVASLCREVSNPTIHYDIRLGRLPPELDVDSDTFPEDIQAFCSLQASDGNRCELSCEEPEYLAMADCNPPREIEPPEGCGSWPPDEDWNPLALDDCGDCYDQDCYRGDSECEDRDGDGFPRGFDCDDFAPAINPDAEEICGNYSDENCTIDIEACTDGDVPCDADGDGFLASHGSLLGCGSDCDDTDPNINPSAFEGCGADPENPSECPGCPPNTPEGVDDNCDRRIDEGCFPDDSDGDGVPAELDCDDCNAGVGPDIVEICGNAQDEDCSGGDLTCDGADGDGDGVSAEPIGTDCDDSNASIFPGAPDSCDDGIAQDCAIDLDCSVITDADGDGFGSLEGDCDDSNNAVNPWAVELCDVEGVDEDCDGLVNEATLDYGCVFDASASEWHVLNYSSDNENCGGCRHRCCSGPCDCEGDSCIGGQCLCHGDETCSGDPNDYCCRAGCRDLSNDPENCGSCGNECGPNEVCRPGGMCGLGVCACPGEPDGGTCETEAALRCCPGTGCTDVDEDPHNCGACENDCMADDDHGPQGDRCVTNFIGMRYCACGAWEIVCFGTQWCTEVTHPDNSCGCRDLNSDPRHCGDCWYRCDENESCDEGSCTCGDHEQDCEGTQNDFCCPTSGCVDLNTDSLHCGTCGFDCETGLSCISGECL